MLPHQQELILKAIFQKNNSDQLWQEWLKKYDLDKIESSTYYLLPALYKALEPGDKRELNKLAGIFKRNLTNSLYKLHQSLPIIKALENSNLTPMLIHTCATALSAKENFNCLSVNHVDILISSSEVQTSIAILNNSGWGTNLKLKDKNFIKHRSYIPFWNGSKGKIILHWNSFYPRPHECLNHSMFDNRVSISHQDIKLNIASSHDLFLHCLLHGAEDIFSSCDWIYNAMLIGQSIDWQIDWGKIQSLARQSNNLNSFINSLTYLKNNMCIDKIPLELFQGQRSSPSEFLAKKLCKRDQFLALQVGALSSVGRFLFLNDGKNLRELPDYIKENLGVESLLKYLKFLIIKATIRLISCLKAFTKKLLK